MDIVDRDTRSRMMRGIRGSNTKPEIVIRRLLHAAGFRFRIHSRKLPGRPDIVLKKHRAVFLVHGCFWHGHHCSLFRLPGTRTQFWAAKIGRNRANDARVRRRLRERGWRIAVIWECALKGKARLSDDRLAKRIVRWVQSDSSSLTIRGRKLPEP